MIPKIIHYCWFGGNPKSEIIKKCINSWREFCPDYEIVEWNESNFDVSGNRYIADACADRKWAFVSDYARLHIVYEQGGVYLDTDVLLHSSIDELLTYKCWLASDDVRYIATGLGFGAEAGHPLIKSILDAYSTYEYPSGTNVIRDTAVIEKGLPQWKKSDRNQVIGDVLLVGLKDYGKYARHLYTYTWADEATQKQRELEIISSQKDKLRVRVLWKIKCFVRNPRIIAFFDKRRGTKVEKAYTFCAYDFLDYGALHFFKRIVKKIMNHI